MYYSQKVYCETINFFDTLTIIVYILIQIENVNDGGIY